ncbi:MAG: peptidoglycan-binding protein LysM [Flavobacteriaceae bacterium]|nr:peptidoglycan-binding protein LysM [Bacteroidia bacterium]MBT8288260.1 peptidoglycan-binding protein LysM [Bacteroidia bacterium]NNF74803.1 peptidoglycan-binding protein LysM [Flavobacteriaceae bacterium]NNK73930.1 peptidoglycan-binding protein LysM [Flavobacteriaceae bacterium]
MNKGLIAYSSMPVIVFLSFFFAMNTSPEIDYSQYHVAEQIDEQLETFAPKVGLALNSDVLLDCYASPKLGKSFVGFKEALAFKESRGDYSTVNTLGYLGKYQFGSETLRLIGVYNTVKFMNDPELQEKAFIANTMRNKWVLRRDIKRFVGKRIDGVLITESGILAAAHLAGPGSVKTYLRSYGAIGFSDAFGTSIRNYMRKFSGYDTSFIQPDKKAKVSLL